MLKGVPDEPIVKSDFTVNELELLKIDYEYKKTIKDLKLNSKSDIDNAI